MNYEKLNAIIRQPTSFRRLFCNFFQKQPPDKKGVVKNFVKLIEKQLSESLFW